MTIQLSDRQRSALSDLCKCEEGKGIPIPAGQRRSYSALIDKGLADSLGFGSIAIFRATEKGRQVHAEISRT